MRVLSYFILYVGVALAWIGIPVVGGAVLAAAGALAGEGQIDVRLAVLVAATAAWTGGYAGYLIGRRAGVTLMERPGRWQRQRRRALLAGERFYRRWGPLAVFLTPTWVSGALRMPRSSFLAWNAVAAAVSSVVTVGGAYAVASAVLAQLSARPATIVLIAAGLTLAAIGCGIWLRHASVRTSQADPRARAERAVPVDDGSARSGCGPR